MRYIWQHIKTITETYNGSLPLAHFLKNYFKRHPILGSRDRRILSAMAYSYYRCSKGLHSLSTNPTLEDTVATCMKLCCNEKLLPTNATAAEATPMAYEPGGIFPHTITLSTGISRDEWLQSMLVQPDLFIRIRKDKGKLISLLNGAQIPVTYIADNCLALPNGAKIDTLLPADTYVVQDASSQHTGTYFRAHKNEQWYDCCSGAGGKSLLLKDLETGVRLTVSDKRESIIHNLHQRFRQYRLELPTAHVTDVANSEQLAKALGTKQFDNIICDAPCSGSGTWARTPEQMYFFDPATVSSFSTLQKTIATNVARYLKPGGRLIYITCSVFANENEEVVNEVVKQTGLQIQSSQLINGTGMHADSMYVAVLT